MTITGPFEATGPGDTPSRRRIFICHPQPGQEDLTCAKKILSALARRAYRRPVNDNDMEEVLSFYQRGRNKGSFDQGIEMADAAHYLPDPSLSFAWKPTPLISLPISHIA